MTSTDKSRSRKPAAQEQSVNAALNSLNIVAALAHTPAPPRDCHCTRIVQWFAWSPTTKCLQFQHERLCGISPSGRGVVLFLQTVRPRRERRAQ
eukprot:4919706-Alexandrium_andersonii.AAC.1